VFSFLRVSSSKKKLRVRLTKPRLLRFQSKNAFNLFLLGKGGYGKGVRNHYKVKIRKTRTAGRQHAYAYFPTTMPIGKHAAPTRCLKSCLSGKTGSYVASLPRLKKRKTVRRRALRKFERVFRLRNLGVLRFACRKVVLSGAANLVPPRARGAYHIACAFTFSTSRPVSWVSRPGISFRGNSYTLVSALKRRVNPAHGSTSISPTTSKSFMLHYVGLLLLSKLNFRVRLGSYIVSVIRKKLYSFLKPNELRFRAFSARRKLTTIKLVRALGKSSIAGRK